MRKSVRTYLLLLAHLWMGWLASCQEPETDIDYPNPDEAFTTDATLGEQLEMIAKLDGSEDNLIDNCSCLEVVFPVEASVKGKSMTFTKLKDLKPVQELYNLNPYDPDFIDLKFPFKARTNTYKEVTINNQEALNRYISSCNEWGSDEDIECVDFVYPISFSIYDKNTQQAITKEISKDEILYNTLNNLSSSKLISLNFPLTLIAENEEININDQAQLQLALDQLEGCEENDRRYYALEELSMGRISLSITDAPFPIDLIEEANITISRIDIKTGEANDSVEFITLFNDTASFNLVELLNGVTSDLAEMEIPEGTYEFFKVYVIDAGVRLSDGQVFDLNIPSGYTSGILIKPNTPIEIDEEETDDYLFDFDISRSFIPQGMGTGQGQIPLELDDITGFNFRPVIRVSHLQESGTLKGTVQNILEESIDNVQITVYAADTVNSTTFTEDNGQFTVLGLVPGEYEVTAEIPNYLLFTSDEIEIKRSETTSYHITMYQ